MDGLLFHEIFILKRNSKSFLLVLLFMVILFIVSMLIMAAEAAKPAYNIYYEGNLTEALGKYTKDHNIVFTNDKSKASLELKISNNDGVLKADIKNLNESTENSLKAKNALELALSEYKEDLVKQNIKAKGLPESLLEPLNINYENSKQLSSREKLTNIIMPLLLFMVIPLFIYILFSNGLLDERKSKSIYTILLLSMKPWKKLLVLTMFRVVIGTLFVTIFSFIIIFMSTRDFIQTALVCLVLFLNLCFLNNVMLLASLYVKNQNYITLASIFTNSLLFIGWILDKSIAVVYIPFFYGISVARTLLYGDKAGINIIICILSYVIWLSVLLYLGVKLLKSEKVLKVEVV